MSKPVKQMIMADYKRRFEELEGALVIDIRGIEANANNQMRLGLADKEIRVTVIKNSLAKKAFEGTGLQSLTPALRGPSALAYGGTSVVDVARELVEWARKVDDLDLKGAVLDGEYYDGADGVKRLSQFPTRDEAKAKVVQLVLSPAGRLLGGALSPGARLLGVIREIQQRLEADRTIEKIA